MTPFSGVTFGEHMRKSLLLPAVAGSLLTIANAYADTPVPTTQDGGIPTMDPVISRGIRIYKPSFTWGNGARPGGAFGRGDGFWGNFGDLNENNELPADSCQKVGDPVVLSTGNEIQSELDFMAGGEMGLYLDRSYNGKSTDISLFGYNWLSSFDYRLSFGTSQAYGPVGTCYARPSIAECLNASSHATAWAHRPDGRLIKFIKAPDGVYYEDKPSPVSKMVLQADGTWLVTFEDNFTELYSKGGYPLWIQNEYGVRWTYSYGGLNGTQVQRVTHSSGRYVAFRWVDDELREIDDPAGNTIRFTYTFQKAESGFQTLKTVALPGLPATTITYHYANETGETTGGFSALTGKSYNGVRYSTIAYGSLGVASTELAGAVERHTFSYTTGANGAFSTTVTNPLGRQTTYDFQNGDLITITGQPTTHCPLTAKGNQYDTNGYPDVSTDFNGNVTNYDYNAKGQLLQSIEGSGTLEARTTTYTWSPTQNRVTRVVVAGLSQTDYAFTTDNHLDTVTVTNLTSNGVPNQALTTKYSYTKHPNGLLATVTVDGPLPGTSDSLVNSYDAYGNLTSAQNSLGHVTSYSNYDALGRPGRVTGPNGDITDYFYDARGRATSEKHWINSAWQATNYAYDGAGHLASIQQPDGQTRNFEYDAAWRLTREYEEESPGVFAQKRYTYNNLSQITRIDTERTTVPAAIPVISAPSSSTNGSYTVSWSSTTDTTGYRLEENTNGGAWAEIQNAVGTNRAISGKINGTYGYRVRACNAAGCSAYSSTASVVVALSGPPTTPSLGASTTYSTTGMYSLTWNSVPGATSYQLSERKNAGAWVQIYNAAGTTTSRNNANGTYDYQVRACNTYGCSAYSSLITVLVEKETCPSCLMAPPPEQPLSSTEEGGNGP